MEDLLRIAALLLEKRLDVVIYACALLFSVRLALLATPRMSHRGFAARKSPHEIYGMIHNFIAKPIFLTEAGYTTT